MHISHKKKDSVNLPELVILGCGNALLGDDGFGPAVIERLEQTGLPQQVQAIDVGTSVREHLLDYLMAPNLRPSSLIIVDATYLDGQQPGTVSQCRPADLASCKVHDFSLHQFPTVNLLSELQLETGIDVVLLLAQAATVPEEIAPGLTPAMAQAVERATEMILHRISPYVTPFSSGTPVAAAESIS
ncbi:MAG: hydrogenase maturation protease [Desulfobulbus sp.]|nr:hydrogenase maturation protease [Desulfobulbus sp.]